MVTTTTRTAETELIDTGEKRDALGRRRTPPERRAELLAEYRRSGLTQTAFAKREGIRYSTFCTWAQAEREAGRMPAAQAGGRRGRPRKPKPAVRPPGRVNFAEVKLGLPLDGLGALSGAERPAVSPPGLEVRLADGTLLRGGSATELAQLVRALRA